MIATVTIGTARRQNDRKIVADDDVEVTDEVADDVIDDVIDVGVDVAYKLVYAWAHFPRPF